MATLLLLLVAGPYAESSAEELLDATTGVIDGKTALAIYPLRYEGRKAKEVLDTDGCTASLKSRSTFEIYERPCGEWFLVPPDSYDYWAESDWQISHYSSKLIYFGGEFGGKGLVGGAPLGPAGRVLLPSGFERTADLQFRLLHAETPSIDGLIRGSISRRLTFEQVGEYQVMPAGRTVAAVWDVRADRYEMLSPPFELADREAVEPPLSEPQVDKAQLIAQVIRHTRAHTVEEDQLQVSLELDGDRIEPVLRFGDADRVYAVWYDLPPGTAQLRATTAGAKLEESVSVQLTGGRIERAVGQMVEHLIEAGPTVEIEVELPESMSDEELSVIIREKPDDSLVETLTLGPDSWTASVGGLPRAVLSLELHTSLGVVKAYADLSAEDNAFVRIAPDLIVVDGTVLVGDEPTEANLTATTTTRETLEAVAGADGLYELVSLEPIRAISVDTLGSGTDQREPFVEIFFDAIAESTSLDLTIPDNRYEVLVLNALTGEPIEEATVVGKNRYQAQVDDETKDKSVSQTATTDAHGVALLPALRAGTVELTAEAQGYRQLEEPLTVEVPERTESRTLEIRLQPEGAMAELRLTLPNGSPAEGAAVFVEAADGSVLSEELADEQGRAEVAATDRPGAVLLVRHERTAFHLETWQADVGDSIRRTLDPSASPLRLRVMDAWGEEPVRHARLALWIDDLMLAEHRLYRLTGNRPLADEHGYWTIAGLPQSPIGVVAWSSGSQAGLELSRMRAMATEISPPWPEMVEIRLVGDP